MTLSLLPFKRLLPTVLACCLAVSAGGCALLGVIAHKASPPPKVPARYTLKPEPTVVLVERASNPGEAAMDAQRIAQLITQLMRENGVTQVIDPSRAMEARSRRNPDGSRLRPSELARAVGASQFVYVDLTRYETTEALAGQAADGQAEAAVWVVDARSAQPVWPPEANQGHPVAAAVPFAPSSTGTTPQSVRDKLNQDLALDISRLFYTWTAE